MVRYHISAKTATSWNFFRLPVATKNAFYEKEEKYIFFLYVCMREWVCKWVGLSMCGCKLGGCTCVCMHGCVCVFAMASQVNNIEVFFFLPSDICKLSWNLIFSLGPEISCCWRSFLKYFVGQRRQESHPVMPPNSRSVDRASFKRSQVGATLLMWVRIPALATLAALFVRRTDRKNVRIGKCFKLELPMFQMTV